MRRYRAMLFLVLILSLFFSGCVYFNTLYNAKRLYSSARARPLTNGKPNSQAIDEYTKAIKKCGYILTEYKTSSYASQALFLLSECLYYKGNSNLQAYEKCQDFMKFYPNDKLAPEVILLESVLLHEMKKSDEAISLLQNFLTVPDNKKYYPRAYLELSVISMDEKAYAQAQYFLQKIIDNYPHSREYKDAFFQLGYAYHIEMKYAQSNQVFQKLLKSRLEKAIKLDARYYIALNDYYLKNYKKVTSEIKYLSKAESRVDKIPLIQLLKARNLLGLNDYVNAVKLYETIIKDNPRTSYSAEANYYLGEFNLNYQHDYEKAITYYNNVKTEFFTSPFVEDSMSKSAIASQIILYNKKDSNLSVTDMVNQQLKLAEYYLHSMNLPDSAVSVYQRIIENREKLNMQLDSLEISINKLDSLGVPKDTIKVNKSDSLFIDKRKAKSDSLAQADSTKKQVMDFPNPKIQTTQKDSISSIDSTKTESKIQIPKEVLPQKDSLSVSDSLQIQKTHIPVFKSKEVIQDSLKVKYTNFKVPDKAETDSNPYAFTMPVDTTTVRDTIKVVKKTHINTPEMQNLLAKETQFKANLMEYDSEYVPLALFDEVWVYKYSSPDSVRMEEVYQELLNKYPLNKYTHAATLMLQGKPIVVTTDEELAIEERYDEAMNLYDTSPDSAKTILKSIADLKDTPYSDKSKFSLGYLYWFNEHDSLNAKPYFDNLLKESRTSDYSNFILQFYDGKNFVFISELPSIKEMEERDRKKKEEAEAKELEQKELNKPVIYPLPRESSPEYVLPPMPEKPLVPNEVKSEKDTLSPKQEEPRPEEPQPEPKRLAPHVSIVDQPQPEPYGEYRPYDFTLPKYPVKH